MVQSDASHHDDDVKDDSEGSENLLIRQGRMLQQHVKKRSKSRGREIANFCYSPKNDLRLRVNEIIQDAKDGQEYLILSNRWIFWITACLSSLVFTFSVATSLAPRERTGVDNVVLAFSSLSVFFCGVVALSFFLIPMHSILDLTETAIAILLLCLWSGLMLVIMGVKHNLALSSSGLEIWNLNLFYSGWVSFSLVIYLFCDLVTIDVSSAMLPSWYKPNNIIRRTWLLYLCLSIILVTVAVRTKFQGACYTVKDRSAVECSTQNNTTAGLGVVSGIISISSFCLFHQWYAYNLKDAELATYGFMLALLSMISSMVNAAITTTENRRERGAMMGIFFYLCWGSFCVSFYLCCRYVEVFTLQAIQEEQDELTAPYSRSSSRNSIVYDELEAFHMQSPRPAAPARKKRYQRNAYEMIEQYQSNDNGTFLETVDK